MKDNLNKLSPWWVTGITDSEGNFSINYNSKSKKVSASFKVTQKDHSLVILTDLKDFFSCGNINIDNSKFNAYKFTVNKISDLINIIIPHFDKYPLVGSKYLDFIDFKKIVLLLSEGNLDDLEEILLIKNKMNKKRSYEERWDYLNKLTFDLKSEWIQAFVDGEGTFQCRIADTINEGKNYVSINPTLQIARRSHDIEVLNAIKNFFGIGYLKPKYDIKSLDASKKSRSVNRLIINQSKIIIDFFDKNPLFTRKHLDFLDWKKIIELKSVGTHKTKEGVQNIINLKVGMNRGRLLNSNLLNSTSKLEIIRWYNKKGYHTKAFTNHKNDNKKKKDNKNKRTVLQSIWLGIKVGWNAPMLPPKVLNVHNHPFVRISRVIGGICIITFLSKKYLLFIWPFNYIVLIFALLHFMYITIISIIKLFYGIKVLRSDKLEVRNSPLDRFAGTVGKILYCWKYGCQAGSAGLGLVGTSFLIDSMLEAGNQEKVFTPLIGKGVKFFVKGNPADEILLGIKNDTRNLEVSKKTFNEVTNMLKEAEKTLDNNSDFSKEEIHELKSIIKKIKDTEQVKITDLAVNLAKKIREYSNSNK